MVYKPPWLFLFMPSRAVSMWRLKVIPIMGRGIYAKVVKEK